MKINLVFADIFQTPDKIWGPIAPFQALIGPKAKINDLDSTYLGTKGFNLYGFRLKNKANLRDLIAATGLAILLKLDSNRRFFSPCDLEI